MRCSSLKEVEVSVIYLNSKVNMGIPFSRFIIELSHQRNIDAIECLELADLLPEEFDSIQLGLLKQDIFHYFHFGGLLMFLFTVYRGRLIERGRREGVSLMRLFTCCWAVQQYNYCGHYLAACLLWGDTKYIYYKYEPFIRRARANRGAVIGDKAYSLRV
mmetsp:Transcript_18242/g.32698  ORF Transcript_18242/g.32698 Transcript_18242/m.32698 type:complete len:160 (+) Transcript_18242:1624-2103(+)